MEEEYKFNKRGKCPKLPFNINEITPSQYKEQKRPVSGLPSPKEIKSEVDWSQFNKQWDALRLLHDYMELAIQSGNTGSWDCENASMSPYKVRYLRIMSVLDAYKFVGYCPDFLLGFKQGVFISASCSEAKILEIYSLLEKIIPLELACGIDVSFMLSCQQQRKSLFIKLMEFRLEIEKLAHHWNGVLEAMGGYHLALKITQNLYKDRIVDVSNVLDRILILLLGDDFDTVFTEKELIEKYDYPTITDSELYKMDLDW